MRFDITGIALVMTTSACSLLVSVDGLTGGEKGDPATHQQPGAPFTPLEGDASTTDGGYAPPVTSRDASSMVTDAPVDSSTSEDPSAFEAGSASSPTDAPNGCIGDLSNTGTSDFQISFSFKTTSSASSALVNQRSACGAGAATYWDVKLSGNSIQVDVQDASNYCNLVTSGEAVGDGALHAVRIQRLNEQLSVSIDGSASGGTGCAVSFGPLPPVSVGTDACDGPDGAVALNGTITNLCITSP